MFFDVSNDAFELWDVTDISSNIFVWPKLKSSG